jgi:predicted secreted protein
MPDGFLGRDLSLQWGGNSPSDALLGVREKGIEINGEAVDVTSDDNDGWRTLLSEPGQKEVTLSLSGVTKDNRLKSDWFNNRRVQPAILTYPDGATITGNFYLASFNETGTYNEATTFEAELQSTGEVTYSAGV